VSPAKGSPAKASRARASRARSAPAGAAAESSALPVVSPAQLTLLPRPEPPPEALAAIVAAAQLLWARPAVPEEPRPPHDAWRFSGRWWAQPALVRRARPWARP
jgi:hypothetical protein